MYMVGHMRRIRPIKRERDQCINNELFKSGDVRIGSIRQVLVIFGKAYGY